MNARLTSILYRKRDCFLKIALLVICSAKVGNCYSCGDPGSIQNGDRIFLMGRRLVQFVCNTNYQIYGSPMLSCTKGQWRGSQPVCVATGCIIPPQQANLIHTQLLNGAVLKFECVGDLVLRGYEIIYCNKYKWSGASPTCERVHKVLLPGHEDTVEINVPVRPTYKIPNREIHGEGKIIRPIFVDSSDRETPFRDRTSDGNGSILPLYKTVGNNSNESSEKNTQGKIFQDIFKPQHRLGGIPTRTSDPSRIHKPIYFGRTYNEYSRPSQYDSQHNTYPALLRRYGPNSPAQGSRYPYHFPMGTHPMAPQFSYPSLNFGRTKYKPFGNSRYGMFPRRNETLVNKVIFKPTRNRENYSSNPRLLKQFHRNNQEKKRPKEILLSKTFEGSNQEQENIPNMRKSTGGNDSPSNASFKKLGSIKRIVAQSCPLPRKPTRGYYITKPLPRNADDAKYQYYVEYHCFDGFVIIGVENTSYCTVSGQWTGSVPSCEEFRKSCKAGFRLNEDGICVDIEECGTENGGCEQICQNFLGGFHCGCSPGYSLGQDRISCRDENECLVNNGKGPCDHFCRNTEGSFSCSCAEGYALSANGSTCFALRRSCSSLNPIDNGRVLPRPCVGEYDIPIGKVCLFVCHSGYKLMGSSRHVCEKNGWSGRPATCVIDTWCPPLHVPEGVVALPGTCMANSSTPGMLCIFQCKDSSQVIQGSRLTRCGINRRWDRDTPRCIKKFVVTTVTPEIVCPPDIEVDLAPGFSTANVTIKQPITNMQIIEQRHNGRISRDSFQAGVTRVTFTAFSDDRNSNASCDIHVRVRDTEAPLIKRCPESHTIETKIKYPTIYWKPPLFSDNVGVTNVKEIRQPQGNITWGTYNIKYVASDTAGNVAECAFTIFIKRVEAIKTSKFRSCRKLADPRNGKALCQTWAHGVYCIPTCNSWYAFEQRPPTYVCNERGQWTPNTSIPDCIDLRSKFRLSRVREKLQTTIIPQTEVKAANTSINLSTLSYEQTHEKITDSLSTYLPYTTKTKIRTENPYVTLSPPETLEQQHTDNIVPATTLSSVSANTKMIFFPPTSLLHLELQTKAKFSAKCRRGMGTKISPKGERICFKCPPGTYGPHSTTSYKCIPCAHGYYQHQYGMGYCIQCPNYIFFRRRYRTYNEKISVGFQSAEACQGWILEKEGTKSKD